MSARIGEVLQLDIGNLNFDADPVEICFPGKNTKNGQGGLTFIFQKAAQAVKEWIKVRNAYVRMNPHKIFPRTRLYHS